VIAQVPGGSAPDGIELRELRWFLAVADELHLGSAATCVEAPEAALSQALRDLEASVGVRLVDDAFGAISLTEAGEAFAERCRRTLSGVDLAVAEARRAAGIGVPVRMGCVPGMPVQLLQAFLGAIHARDAAIELEVAHLSGAQQLRRLRRGDLDLAILHDPGGHDTMRVQPLFPGERLAAYLPQGHRLAVHAAVGPDDLVGETLVVPSRQADPVLHDRLLALVEGSGFRFRAIREAGGGHPRDVLFAAATGLGVALGPTSLRQVVGDVATIVTRCMLDPAAWMPDMVVAWAADPPARLAPVLDAARRAAAMLHGD
jgi:DNA-binding transcriptional LysR family regulator